MFVLRRSLLWHFKFMEMRNDEIIICHSYVVCRRDHVLFTLFVFVCA